MDLDMYFRSSQGMGVLATADGDGRVDAAVYSRPHVLEADQVAFIMPDRLTHRNLQSNPHAAYLFREDSPGYKGVRLFLRKVREEQDSDLLMELRRGPHAGEKGSEDDPRFLVIFRVERILPLIGSG
ncbi:MAG: pyridoxamine 5'-phosphate oxidase family protein [Desulfobacteraceae bacterium]